MTQPKRRSRVAVAVAIRRPDDASILVLPNGSLPSFELDRATPWQLVAPVAAAMLAEGLTVTTLRAAWVDDDTGGRLFEAVLLAGHVPSRASWVPRGELADALAVATTPFGIRSAIGRDVLASSDGTLQPWYAPGWLDGMCEWIDARLADAGLRRHGPIRQMRSWGRGALLQAATDRGPVWAKEVPARFAHEIAVTGLLADLDPGLVPPLIAADPGSGRLLTANVDGPLLADIKDPAAWTATLARLAETQRVLSSERDRLVIAGVASAPVSSLAVEIPALLADRDLLRVDQPGGMTTAEQTALTDHTADLQAACRTLSATAVPDSLDHGDFSAAQVIVGEMGPVILDWSDASITHPFLALAAFGGDEDGTRAYIDVWGASISPSVALEAARAARLVEPLHLARSYRDRILPGLEQPWEMDRVVPARLTGLLRELERHDAVVAP